MSLSKVFGKLLKGAAVMNKPFTLNQLLPHLRSVLKQQEK
jgi:hypothetical protein